MVCVKGIRFTTNVLNFTLDSFDIPEFVVYARV